MRFLPLEFLRLIGRREGSFGDGDCPAEVVGRAFELKGSTTLRVRWVISGENEQTGRYTLDHPFPAQTIRIAKN